MRGLPLAQMIIIDGELSQTQPSMQHQQGQIQEFLMGGRVVVLLPNYSPGPSRPTLYHQKNLNLPQNRGGGGGMPEFCHNHNIFGHIGSGYMESEGSQEFCCEYCGVRK